jgi:predicted nucleic acid-binding Zn ribbon protein
MTSEQHQRCWICDDMVPVGIRLCVTCADIYSYEGIDDDD